MQAKMKVFWPLSAASLTAPCCMGKGSSTTCEGLVTAHCPTRGSSRRACTHRPNSRGCGLSLRGVQQSGSCKGEPLGSWTFRPKASSQRMCTEKGPTFPRTATCRSCERVAANLFPALATDGDREACALRPEVLTRHNVKVSPR